MFKIESKDDVKRIGKLCFWLAVCNYFLCIAGVLQHSYSIALINGITGCWMHIVFSMSEKIVRNIEYDEKN